MPKIDKEMEQFEKDLLQSIGEMKSGKHAAVHTPGQIEARKRGRPVGSVKAEPKVSTNVRFDQDVLVKMKATGPGWQTRLNDTMRVMVSGAAARNVRVAQSFWQSGGLANVVEEAKQVTRNAIEAAENRPPLNPTGRPSQGVSRPSTRKRA
ncbi:hypothetical protein GmRootV118_17990 [Variovorax sp. V118]|uniref:BrnA antitoxin family protein n=1 Tax=Variovorax sp. V118 TaxID=3065954 RepID=UPI0034E8D2E8